jgi:hypothetical protein
MRIEGSFMVFECSGKEFFASDGIIGIEQNLIVSEGYDGKVPYNKFTQEEREELSNYMIDLWTRFKERT